MNNQQSHVLETLRQVQVFLDANAAAVGPRQNHMRPIAGVAKQKLRDVPEFHALTMPPSNATSAQLVARASAMADAAQSYDQVFTAVGLPDDFIPWLRSTADDVSKSIDDRKQHTGKRSGATAGLSAEEKRGRHEHFLYSACNYFRNDRRITCRRVPARPISSNPASSNVGT